MRGSRIENVTLTTLALHEWMHGLYNCGMLADADNNWCACSPDGIAIMHRDLLPVSNEDDDATWGPHSSVSVVGNNLALPVVEIKTAVSRRRLDLLLNEVSCDPKMVLLTSPEARGLTPTQHMMEVAQQMTIVGSNYAIYVCTSEVRVLLMLVLYCTPEALHIIRTCILSLGSIYVK